MSNLYLPLFSSSFLEAHWKADFRDYKQRDGKVLERLRNWDARQRGSERADEAAFINVFFRDIWEYRLKGEADAAEGFECTQQYRVPGAGTGGGTGSADLALGCFGRPDLPPIPQVLCEFKDIKSGLDEPQRRKGDSRSPVKQCADYIRESLKPLYGNEPIQPRWGIVTDMNEFRLYWWNRMPSQYQRFLIRKPEGSADVGLLDETDAGQVQRFLFWRMFRKDMLLTEGGTPVLVDLIARQGQQAKAIEEDFYEEYADYRLKLYNAIAANNAERRFTETQLLQMAQKILDRCIFTLFCEDMGVRLRFPPELLKDFLVYTAGDPIFTDGGNEIWQRLCSLFAAMDEGTRFFRKEIRKFNGGLFKKDEILDSLHIPNHVFCRMGGKDVVEDHPGTLLYFAQNYNFGIRNDGEKSISLYTLGRIFEQSVRDIEEGIEGLRKSAEARATRRASNRRKREGVYYTPEWVVQKIVEETVGTRLAELRQEFGCDGPAPRNGPERKVYMAALEAYARRLETFTVLDPACGSGAFLIHATEFLLAERERVLRALGRWEDRLLAATDHVNAVLTQNIFGVDINPAAVEIARLSVWLYTVQPDFPLSHLDSNIVRGNSLVGPDIWARPEAEDIPAHRRDEVAAFDWDDVYGDVRGRGGFDCVVGNPPYVKLQNYKPHHPETVAYLTGWGRAENAPYASTTTGNMDVYLPFIEKGLELMAPGGRMGYIAPNIWLVAEYGAGLRRLMHGTRQLDRWVDFKSYQVFDEVTTYTALQFFTKEAREAVRFVLAPDGAVASLDWTDPDCAVPYDELPGEEPWVLVPAPERRLIAGVMGRSRRLDDPEVTTAVFQGLITSADWIYHLEKVSPGTYRQSPPKAAPVTVEIEDAIMLPLVSGADVKRYVEPSPSTHILFPYDGPNNRLFTPEEMAARYPKAWRYLGWYERQLRARENASFDDERWYRFGRHQNIDKQHLPKIMVAETVPSLRLNVDVDGAFCIHNVRVNGIIPADPGDFWYVLGVLNSPLSNFIFRRIARPKDGGYFEANKQFIAPLPVPRSSHNEKSTVTQLAKELSALHSDRRRALVGLDRRLDGMALEEQAITRLFPDILAVKELQKRAPVYMDTREAKTWAKERHDRALADRLEALDKRLGEGGMLSADLNNGELRILLNGQPILDKVFVSDAEGEIILAQWRRVCQSIGAASRTNAEALTRELRKTRSFGSKDHQKQVIDLSKEVAALEARILEKERALNDILYRLYGLTDAERAMVEKDGWTPFG